MRGCKVEQEHGEEESRSTQTNTRSSSLYYPNTPLNLLNKFSFRLNKESRKNRHSTFSSHRIDVKDRAANCLLNRMVIRTLFEIWSVICYRLVVVEPCLWAWGEIFFPPQRVIWSIAVCWSPFSVQHLHLHRQPIQIVSVRLTNLGTFFQCHKRLSSKWPCTVFFRVD